MKHYAIAAAVATLTTLAGHSLAWCCFGVAVATVYALCREAEGEATDLSGTRARE